MIENPNVICNDCAYCKQNKELCKKIDELYDNIDIWIAENAKLRKLLGECECELRGSYIDLGWEDWSLIDKIEQALGEDK